jgi:hypothetical protein
LVNLNFLELSGGGELASLPDTLGTLQNLTTLLLKAKIASVFFTAARFRQYSSASPAKK